MNRFTAVYSSIWDDEAFEDLSDLGKLVYFNLLCNPTGNIAGYFRIRPKHIALYLGCDPEKVKQELEGQKRLWKYDPGTSQVFIRNYLKYNKVGGEKTIKGLAKQVEYLERCPLHKDFMFAVYKYLGEESIPFFDHYTLAYVKQLCKEDPSDPISAVLLTCL